jgi:molybdopterin-synthase adenylyltransferase
MNNRFERQAALVPAERMAAVSSSVIGIGAVGRQVALQLAAIGVRQIQLIDFDRVEPTNVTTQGYFARDIGSLKVDATREAIAAIDPAVAVQGVADRFRAKQSIGQVVFCCVDSITSRAAIWRALQHRIELWIDGRMLGEVIRVLAAWDTESRTGYDSTLFAQSEAHVGQCTAHSTIYAASIAAGLMVHIFSRWLRPLPLDSDTTVNLLAGEWNAYARDPIERVRAKS